MFLLSFQSHNDYSIDADDFAPRAVLDRSLQSFVLDAEAAKDFSRLELHRMKRSQKIVVLVGLRGQHHEFVVVVARLHRVLGRLVLRVRADLNNVVVLNNLDGAVLWVALWNNLGAVDERIVAFVDI